MELGATGCPRAKGGGCAGGCERCCGGCRSTALSGAERDLLACFGAYAFLPVVQDVDTGELLPLEGYDYSPWRHHLTGSAALTLRGQALLDELEYGG